MRTIATTLAAVLSLCLGACGGADVLDTTAATLELRVSGDGAQTRWGAYGAYEHFVRADVLANRDDLEGAASEMREALAGDPDDFLLRTEYARILTRLGRYRAARRHLARAVLMEPTAQTAWVALAELREAQGDAAGAVEAARHGMRVEPAEPEAARWMADHLMEEKRWEEAADLCRGILSVDPRDLEALRCAARSSLAREEYRAARGYLARYCRGGGTRAEGLISRAREDLGTDEEEEWILFLEQLVEIDPENREAREELIELLLGRGMGSRAVAHVRSLGDSGCGDQLESRRRASWLLEAGAPYEARAAVLESIGAGGAEPETSILLARTEIELDRPEVALVILEPLATGLPPDLAAKARTVLSLASRAAGEEQQGETIR